MCRPKRLGKAAVGEEVQHIGPLELRWAAVEVQHMGPLPPSRGLAAVGAR